MTRHTAPVSLLCLLLAATPSACLDDSKAGTALQDATATPDTLSPSDPGGGADSNSADDVAANATPTPVCRTFATSTSFPDAGAQRVCAFDADAITMTCTMTDVGESLSVVTFPSLEAFVAAREIGAETATKQVLTTAKGAVYETQFSYDDAGKMLGSVRSEDGEIVEETTMTAWDGNNRWLSATVSRKLDGCTWEWARVIDDAAKTIVTSRADSDCVFDLVTRLVFDDNGLPIYSEAGDTADDLAGGEVVNDETSTVCAP